MPNKDTFTIAPGAASMITALTALIGPGVSVDAGFAFRKSTGSKTTKDVAAPTVAPTNV